MPLTKNYAPKELFPKCIWFDFFRGIALNAVGLGGPGAYHILKRGTERFWKQNKPFMISYAPEGDTADDRIYDVRRFTNITKKFLTWHPWLQKILGLQCNLSCPNSTTNPEDLTREAQEYLDILRELNIPVGIKINLLVPVSAIKEITSHPTCDFLCLANTIPFGQLPDEVPWDKWFPNGSPLAEFKSGGLSGRPLLPLLIKRIQEIRWANITIPINAGGGILSADDAVRLIKETGLKQGRDSIFIGSIAMLRPWNIKPVIRVAHELL
jgi:dihydroorotate dehydrogenase